MHSSEYMEIAESRVTINLGNRCFRIEGKWGKLRNFIEWVFVEETHREMEYVINGELSNLRMD